MQERECEGIRLHTGGDRCLAHPDRQDRDAELKRLMKEGTIDARGVMISAELLESILDAAPPDEDRPSGLRLSEERLDRGHGKASATGWDGGEVTRWRGCRCRGWAQAA
jgi:hypothetical protein